MFTVVCVCVQLEVNKIKQRKAWGELEDLESELRKIQRVQIHSEKAAAALSKPSSSGCAHFLGGTLS